MIKIPTLFKRTFDDNGYLLGRESLPSNGMDPAVLSLEDNSLKDTMRNTVNLFRKML